MWEPSWASSIQQYVKQKREYIDSSGWRDLGIEDPVLCVPKNDVY